MTTENTNALAIREKYLPGNRKALEDMAEHTGAIYEMIRMNDNSPMTAIAMANAMQMLRESITPEVICGLRKLQGSPLGFLTDKDKGEHTGRGQYAPGSGYDDDTIRDVTIAAAARGARMYGNEVNIIKGKAYLTKEFYKRLLDDALGRWNWHTTPDIPRTAAGGAVISGKIWWRDSEGEHNDTCQFAIKGDATSMLDQLVGKWEKRARQMIYERSTGEAAPDAEAGDVVDLTAKEVVAEQKFMEGESFIDEIDQRRISNEAAHKGLSRDEVGFLLFELGYNNDKEIRKCDMDRILKAIRNAMPGRVITANAAV